MPSRKTRTHKFIPAPLEQVWAALLDLDGYARWNPGLRLRPWAGAALREGGRAWLKLGLVRIPVVVPVRIESASRNRLCWIGGPPGLFRGRHFFELREVEGGTELTHGEDFAGLALPLLWPLVEPELERMYQAVNDALADYVTR